MIDEKVKQILDVRAFITYHSIGLIHKSKDSSALQRGRDSKPLQEPLLVRLPGPLGDGEGHQRGGTTWRESACMGLQQRGRIYH